MYLPSLIFCELQEEVLGDLAVTAYPIRLSPLRFFRKPNITSTNTKVSGNITTNANTGNITSNTTKRLALVGIYFLLDVPVEGAIAPHKRRLPPEKPQTAKGQRQISTLAVAVAAHSPLPQPSQPNNFVN